MSDQPLGNLNITGRCAYCGSDLLLEASSTEVETGATLNLDIEWDHVCTMPPPLISSQFQQDSE